MFEQWRKVYENKKEKEGDDDEGEGGDDDGDDEGSVASDGSMRIFIKMPNGKTITLAVEANDTIDTVKALVREKSGIPRKEQRLIFAGQQLEEGRMLSDYSIKHDDELQMFLRGRGGAISL